MEFEKLGAFYLGKQYDLAAGKLSDQLTMYDARDLTTHAVCVGMTGSGKTGLCIGLLEEAALDHVPAIIIDPKGDITNLLLTFPDLLPEDFRPWINVDDARRKGISEDEFAAQQAKQWKDGLATWGQDGNRIRMLRDSTDFTIYTPGSDAGVPVSILQSFAVPALSWDTDAELARERVQGVVGALLGLVGVEADPVRSREHILLANLFEHFWRQGQDLDLAKLILAIQNPPIRQLGVFDVDTFFPQKDRFGLAMSLNNIMAAPSFQTWLTGQPLDVAGFLGTPTGKPRHSIFYIAHLSDAERMFFVTMLLSQVITWMRAQPGTTSLRALLYMDEIFGFFPPIANPPSKQPMLTLMKQARAFGLGVVLTTQNPVDLDYKGLTNAGTWFIGRLQTERDKARLLEGMQGASAAAGQALDPEKLGRVISGLGNRVFLLHNVHEEAPVTFQTRWAMSYLRGPLTRQQVGTLMSDRQPDAAVVAPTAKTGVTSGQPASIAPAATPAGAQAVASATLPPSLPPGIRQVYIPVRKHSAAATREVETQAGGPVEVQSQQLAYVPAVLGIGRVHFVDRARDVDASQDFALLVRAPDRSGAVRWDQAQPVELVLDDLGDQPESEAHFHELPEPMNEARELTALQKDLVDHLYRSSELTLLYSPILKIYSRPDETERDFVMRLSQAAREKRDDEVDELNDRYEARLRQLQARLNKSQVTLAKKKAEAEARQREVLVSVGESVLGMFMGRRSSRGVSSAMGKYRQSGSAGKGAEEVSSTVEALQQEIEEIEAELKQETEEITRHWDEALEKLDRVPVPPRRNDIDVDVCALAWTPFWEIAYQARGGTQQTELVPGY